MEIWENLLKWILLNILPILMNGWIKQSLDSSPYREE